MSLKSLSPSKVCVLADGVEDPPDQLLEVLALGLAEGDQGGGYAVVGQGLKNKSSSSLAKKQAFFNTHVNSLVDEVWIVQLVLLRDVVLGELGQLDHLRHDLLLVVGVGQVHQQGDDAVLAV